MSVSSSRAPHASSKKRASEIDLDAKRSVNATDLIVSPPTPSPTPASPADLTAVCSITKRINVSIKGARVLKVGPGRRNVSTLTLRVSRNALENMMDIDEALLAQARTETEDWFGAARIANVDEFFRASTATDRAAGIVAKLSLDVSRSSRSPVFAAPEGSHVDILLQLVGIRFLRQHVDVLWRFVSSTSALGSFVKEIRSLPVSDEENDDNLLLGPTPEEREKMFIDLLARIDAERNLTDNRSRDLDALADDLEDGRDSCDARILETVADRLDVMMLVVVPTCRPDTSCCS